MKNKKLFLVPVLLLGTNCIGCSKEEPHAHTFDQQKVEDKYLASNATCTDQAKYFYSCVCGEKGTETFNSGVATGHKKSSSVQKDADYHWFTCTNPGCNEVFEKTAHNFGELIKDVAPTCSSTGNGHKECSEPTCTAKKYEDIYS